MKKSMVGRLLLAGVTLLALAAGLLFVSSPSVVANAERGRTASIAARQASAQTDDGSVTMTLLHNNDGESKLLADNDAGFPGVARFAQTWIDLGRSSNADILLRVSSGDNFLASKEFSAGLAQSGPLYDSVALRGLYEAIGLGNHDFDFGPDVTARFIEDLGASEDSAGVPFLAANIDVSGEPALQALADQGRIAPSTIFTDPISGEQVGVIGAITPRLANISSPRDVVVDPDVAGAVNAQVQALGEQGINRIVLVSHLQGLAEDQALIPQLRGVDIVVAGGGDELLKNDGDTCQPDEEAFGTYPLLLVDADGNDVPVVTAPGGYRCIGHLDVTFDSEGEISELEGSSIGVALDGEQEEFAMTRVEEPLTRALVDLDANVLANSDVDLDGTRANVRTQSTNVGALLADALLAAGQAGPDFGGVAPVVAVQNGGGIRNDSVIPAGEITEARTFDIAPFSNFVVTGEISRERFKELLEGAVAGLPDAQGTFPQIAGFSMEIDVDQPGRLLDSDGDCSVVGDPGSRIRSVTLADGTAIVADGDVVAGDPIGLATIDFLAGGGDCYPLSDIDFTKVGVSYQQALATFVQTDLGGTISASDYPANDGRSLIASGSASQTSTDPAAGDDNDAEDSNTAATDGADESDADETETDESDADETETDQEAADEDEEVMGELLARTGLSSWLLVIIALTIAGAGALIFFEAQRAGWLSFANRVNATHPWDPDATDEN